ncbi:hypothetical protein L1887_50839 [Cichorium endivia]|nr:hypothetical protein L1887_50839 [Cichorium endivia]
MLIPSPSSSSSLILIHIHVLHPRPQPPRDHHPQRRPQTHPPLLDSSPTPPRRAFVLLVHPYTDVALPYTPRSFYLSSPLQAAGTPGQLTPPCLQLRLTEARVRQAPPPAAHKPKTGSTYAKEPPKPNSKVARMAAQNNQQDDDDDDDEETTTDDSSDEEAAFEMDGQELWTQTFCATCDCLIEPGEGIAKSSSKTDPPASPAFHSTLKSRSANSTTRGSNASEQAAQIAADSNKPATGSKDALKRTHSRRSSACQSRWRSPRPPTSAPAAQAAACMPSASSVPPQSCTTTRAKERASPATPLHPPIARVPPRLAQAPLPANRSHSNSSGPSSFKSNEANASVSHPTATDAQPRPRKRGFLGGLGLTPAALKQQEAELAAKRKAPTPLYCSERCRLIDERRSSGLGELAKYPLPAPHASTHRSMGSASASPLDPLRQRLVRAPRHGRQYARERVPLPRLHGQVCRRQQRQRRGYPQRRQRHRHRKLQWLHLRSRCRSEAAHRQRSAHHPARSARTRRRRRGLLSAIRAQLRAGRRSAQQPQDASRRRCSVRRSS